MITFITSFIFPSDFLSDLNVLKETELKSNIDFLEQNTAKLRFDFNSVSFKTFKSMNFEEISKIKTFIEWVKITPNIQYIIYICPGLENEQTFGENVLFPSHDSGKWCSPPTLLYGESLELSQRSIDKLRNSLSDDIFTIKNIKFVDFIPSRDSIVYQYCISKRELLILPSQRNQEKDTFEFILNSHLKHEIIEKTLKYYSHPTLLSGESLNFAWFDISIMEFLKEKETIATYLNWLNSLSYPILKPFTSAYEGKIINASNVTIESYINETLLLFPGCWSKQEPRGDPFINYVNWRFCGAFFMGDKNSLMNFCEMYKKYIFTFLEEYNTLTWDFNFWAYLESNTEWSPTWYKANHDDSIFYFSSDNYVQSLEKIVDKNISFSFYKEISKESENKSYFLDPPKENEFLLRNQEPMENIENSPSQDATNLSSTSLHYIESNHHKDFIFSSERSVDEKEFSGEQPKEFVRKCNEGESFSQNLNKLMDSLDRSIGEDQFSVASEGKLYNTEKTKIEGKIFFIKNKDGSHFLSQDMKNERELLFYKATYPYPSSILRSANMENSNEKYHPMSASYLYDPNTKKHWLSTRYVNYWIYPNGSYHFYNESQLIKSKNVLTSLIEMNVDFNSPSFHSGDLLIDSRSSNVQRFSNVLIPNYSKECNDNLIDLEEVKKGRVSIGLEDIRLFQLDGKTKFIASSIGYSSNKYSQMFIGDYNLENGELTNLKHINSPSLNSGEIVESKFYEKNWIPIVLPFPLDSHKNGSFNSPSLLSSEAINFSEQTVDKLIFSSERSIGEDQFSGDCEGKLYIIYKWGPFQICNIVSNEKGELLLNTIKTYNIINPIFNKLRGSTTFITVKLTDISTNLRTVTKENDLEPIFTDLSKFTSHVTENLSSTTFHSGEVLNLSTFSSEESSSPIRSGESPKYEQDKEYLLGVAHYSEEHSPRHYYHYLILLDKNTLEPLMWSNGFCFEKLGIEFCIGFSLINNMYHFWISRHDRDPVLICISTQFIPLNNIFQGFKGEEVEVKT